jgi:hypothetical protein
MSNIQANNQLSYLHLRTKLHELAMQDLLGPADGPHEILAERNVTSRYILGRLAPKGQSYIPEEDDDLSEGGTTETQDGKAEAPAAGQVSMLPSSIGMTFSVDTTTTHLQVTVHYGYYRRIHRDELDDPALLGEELAEEEGEENSEASFKQNLFWKRWPIEATSKPIELKAGRLPIFHPQPENTNIYIESRCRKQDDAWMISLFLVNAQKEERPNRDEAWLFQPEIEVRHPDGDAVFIKRPLLAATSHADPEDLMMQMLYRQKVEFSVGHGVGTHAELQAGHWERAIAVRTSTVPDSEVLRMEPPAAGKNTELDKTVLNMKELASLQSGEFADALNPIADAYEIWIKKQEDHLQNPTKDLQPYLATAEDMLQNSREALARIRTGIALLDNDSQAAKAFQFANHTMAEQRIRSIYTQSMRQGKKREIEEIELLPRNYSWRPFQLAFVLLNLPGLADPTHEERSGDALQAFVDLLWFPTGGGKTEAYLGVAAFAIGIRRLQGKVGDYDGMAGVTVLMRYTLRLLTLQQFQRATTLIAACEVLRRKDPQTWGTEPFRIGLWVGKGSTPNWTKDSADAIKRDHGQGWSGNVGGAGTPHQLTNCPWCGKPIEPGNDIVVETLEQGRGRTFQYCSDKYGTCPFSRKQARDEGLPIVVVDEEIYRRLPTLLIATVDKFAQMPWKGQVQMLFGRVNGYCERHGYRSPDIEDTDSHRRKGYLDATKTIPAGPLRPPDLIIQDELHLISGPLGTLVGLYETVVDELCNWTMGEKTIRPKVIASTATIRQANKQVINLFMRQVKVFPPSAIDASDNFFSKERPSSEESPGRLYVGVCAPGTRIKTTLLRVYVAYMAAAQKLYEDYGKDADTWMTLVGYFNSLRELGGMKRLAEDTIRTRLRQMDKRNFPNRYIESWTIEELTSRKSATDIPQILDHLDVIFDPLAEEARKAKTEKSVDIKRPLDMVLATNMISVGVDVSRLGLMVVASQPKATAEYIQATSRVGRAFPGLVVTVYNWARPRDLSHYERFEHYHATFYQQVEALSVTPFAKRALDRGLTGVLASYLRLQGEDFNANDKAGQVKKPHPAITNALNLISQRAAIVEGDTSVGDFVRDLLEYRLDLWEKEGQREQKGAVVSYQKGGPLAFALLTKPEESDWQTFTCLNSLRDVEPGVGLILKDHSMDQEPK